MLHCSILIEAGSAPNVRRSQLGTSFLVLLMVEATDLLCLFNTVVFASLGGCNHNCCDSDVSLSDILCLDSPDYVRYSSVQLFSIFTVLQIVLVVKTHPTSKRAALVLLKIPPSHSLPTDWR